MGVTSLKRDVKNGCHFPQVNIFGQYFCAYWAGCRRPIFRPAAACLHIQPTWAPLPSNETSRIGPHYSHMRNQKLKFFINKRRLPWSPSAAHLQLLHHPGRSTTPHRCRFSKRRFSRAWALLSKKEIDPDFGPLGPHFLDVRMSGSGATLGK